MDQCQRDHGYRPGQHTFLGFFQEFRATNVVAKLRERLALRASVRRDGNETALQLVPGDVIVLRAGDLVPADCLILKATDFLVTEARLTGESFPREAGAGRGRGRASRGRARKQGKAVFYSLADPGVKAVIGTMYGLFCCAD